MNPYLAETLIINLIKNAIIHNTSGGLLCVKLINNTLIISNSGFPLTFPEQDIFKRFVRSDNSKKNLGIGLSIVQRICELYTFKIAYTYVSQHQFKIIFKK
jgi:signal transduction histidine kinase